SWDSALIHLIDTPGHIDFTAEVERSIRVTDGAVVIFSAVEGVEAQSEKVWHQAEDYNLPKIAFINKMDRVGASFTRVVGDINRKFGDVALPVQLPVGEEDELRGLIDLVTFQMLSFTGDHNERVESSPVPEDFVESALRQRENLIERLADSSDEVAELYLSGEDVPVDLIQKIVRELTLRNEVVPVVTGSAKKCIGVQPVINAIVEYLPSPLDRGAVPAVRIKDESPVEIQPDSTAAFTGLIFKVAASSSADLLYMRTYSGTLHSGMKLTNSRTKESVRAKQLLRLFAKTTEPVDEVGPGDIVGVIGPKNSGTGDTLCDAHQLCAFEAMVFPEPVISMAVEPRFSREKDRLEEALGLLCREDPTLRLDQDEETGQWLLSGMGELHLEIKLKRLAEEFNVEARAGEPRVAYRETFRGPDTVDAFFHKVVGENEIQAGAKISVSPMAKGKTLFEIENQLGRSKGMPKVLSQTAERALQDGLRTGGNLGYPLIYVNAQLVELDVYPDKSTESAVMGAVLSAIDKAIREVGTTILEPVMYLEILAPPEAVGEITSYLQPRRAVIHSMSEIGALKRISCEVPLAEMFGFGKALPKLTGGRGSFSMEPRGYQEIPADVAARMFGSFAR
ncbi:MAG: GTP-binding protein, partial [Candidatus Pacebacteria bacterium]|nr:GTP-binding protein [Candidatus Paceibacterota bacterium]